MSLLGLSPGGGAEAERGIQAVDQALYVTKIVEKPPALSLVEIFETCFLTSQSHASRLVREARRQDVDVPGGDRDELGHAPVDGDAELLQLLAEVDAADLAVPADAAADADLHGDRRPQRHLRHALADGDDVSRDLVTDDEPAAARRIHLVVNPLIAAADPRDAYADEDLSGAHRRDRHVLEDDAALGRILDDGEHAGSV